MGAMGEFAAKLEAAAAWLRGEAALDVCEAQALAFQRIEREVTPKRSGRLADSETIDSLSGGGGHARAVVSPHTPYAAFRNNGGTITKHSPGSLGNPAVGWFGHSVTQRGSHYVERAEGLAAGALRQAAEAVIEAGLDL